MRDGIRRTAGIIAGVTGQRPVGWMGPMPRPGETTAAPLAEAGFDCILDFADGDSPCLPDAGAGRRMAAVPASLGAHDHRAHVRGLDPPSAHADVFRHTPDRLTTGRCRIVRDDGSLRGGIGSAMRSPIMTAGMFALVRVTPGMSAASAT